MFFQNSILKKVQTLAKQHQAAYQKQVQIRYQIDNIFHKLAVSGNTKELQMIFTILENEPNLLTHRKEALAADIAKTYEVAEINEIAKKYNDDSFVSPRWSLRSFFTLITQELVLHKKDPQGTVLEEITKQYQSNNLFPFAALPLSLLPIEMHENNNSSENMWTKEKGVKTKITQGKKMYHDVTSVQDAQFIQSAVDSWTKQSNGISESKVFKLDSKLTSQELANFVIALPVEVFKDTNEVEFFTMDSIDVYQYLFSIASQGGAYSRKPHGALGRLHTWKSLAGLVGLTQTNDIEKIAEEAKQCTWLYFDNTPWFCNVAWDLGLICLRPNGKSLALLAATDTD